MCLDIFTQSNWGNLLLQIMPSWVSDHLRLQLRVWRPLEFAFKYPRAGRLRCICWPATPGTTWPSALNWCCCKTHTHTHTLYASVCWCLTLILCMCSDSVSRVKVSVQTVDCVHENDWKWRKSKPRWCTYVDTTCDWQLDYHMDVGCWLWATLGYDSNTVSTSMHPISSLQKNILLWPKTS